MNWTEYLMGMAEVVASKSKDTSIKVGCVITGQDYGVRSTGFNGFPRCVEETPKRIARPEKYFWTEHSERNAIYNAANSGISLNQCRLYVQYFPCSDCARGIIQSGITDVITYEPDFKDERWGESFKRSLMMLYLGGVVVHYVQPDWSLDSITPYEWASTQENFDIHFG